MKRSTFNKLKNLLWPEKVIAAKIRLTNGATIDGQCVQITAYGGGGGGGSYISCHEKTLPESRITVPKNRFRLEFFCVSDTGRKTRDRVFLSSNSAGIGVFVQNDLEITSVDISLSDAQMMAEKLLEYIKAKGEKE